MEQEKIDLLLAEAKVYRDNWQFDQAIANLHQIVNNNPQEEKYKYLLASTYLEARNTEAALRYADELLELNTSNKEAYELKGLAYEAEKKYEEAEKNYIKAIQIDPLFINARYNLIQLYSNVFFPNRYTSYEPGYKEIYKDPDFVIKHSNILLEQIQKKIDGNKKLSKLEKRDLEIRHGFTSRLLSIALYKKEEYRECINILENSIKHRSSNTKTFPGFFINDEINIYKLYYLLNDQIGMNEYGNRMREGYDNEKDYKETIERITEEVQQELVYL